MMVMQNEQRLCHAMGDAMMVHLGTAFGLRPGVVRITWHQQEGRWSPEVALPQVPGVTEDQIRATIVQMCREAREILARQFRQNRATRFHGAA